VRVAVTGASGFVGHAVVDRALQQGHEVLALSRRPLPARAGMRWQHWDLTRGPLGPDDAGPVDAVVHAAAHVDDWDPWPVQQRVTVDGTRAVLESFPAARVVLVSSCSVYPLHAPGQRFGEHVPVTTRPLSPYVRAKIAQERVVASRADHAILRPHAVHGPGDTTLLPRLARARRRGRLVCPGSAGTLVHLTDVRLLAEAALTAAMRGEVRGILNVSDASPVRLEVLARVVAAANGWPERPAFIPSPVALAAALALEASARARPATGPPLLTAYGVSHLAVSRTFPHDRLVERLGILPEPTDVTDWTAEPSDRWATAPPPRV
jgi:nucleoside-diphosphate-sugar epimerase